MVELAIVDFEGNTLFDQRIQPLHIETATQEALKINGYDEKLWKKTGLLFLAIAKKVFDLISKATIVAHHASFDASFLVYELRRNGFNYEETKWVTYNTIDTYTLIRHHLVPPLKWATLAAACKELGISNDGAHTALADARRARDVFLALSERVKKSR
jgi:DNA polymerase-3 subunit epsilon